jgi:hypothetical protein
MNPSLTSKDVTDYYQDKLFDSQMVQLFTPGTRPTLENSRKSTPWKKRLQPVGLTLRLNPERLGVQSLLLPIILDY